MLLREDDHGDGTLAIGQPSHAWISGQIARAWGNEAFGAVEPWEEVCLAAEQHDIGMAEWDLAPTFNPVTGLPYGFTEMPLDEHLACWRTGPPRLVRQCRYAALLCSIHGTRLYGRRDLGRMPTDEADKVRAFFSDAETFQDRLRRSLAADPDEVARNSQLIWTWDFLSLALCLCWAPCSAMRVPVAAGEPVELHVLPGPEPGSVALDPWPLRHEALTIRCEGQRLRGPYADAPALNQALARTPWETLELELRPAG